ncbi:MAG: zf-HC2 domain-containing protein [Acidobacteria bacterium]|nr:zf-HC2 domain-containing protein [Acidobacteriota bacterium]
MRECIEEGIIQSYVDDELSPETAQRVAAHIAVCATCSEAAAIALDETALLSSAFEAENALEIPTVKLRERLDAAIAEMNRPTKVFEQKERGSFGGWLTSLAGMFKLSPQRAIGFASLIAVVAFAAIFMVVRLNRDSADNSLPQQLAGNDKNKTTSPVKISRPSPTPVVPDKTSPVEEQKNSPRKSTKPKKHVSPVLVPDPDQLPQGDLAVKPLSGEENYLKAIDSLTVEIEASDVTAMKPSLRAEYERNLAIVNQAIDSTRRVARRNPNNPDASEFLYSSYQSKLDLLNAVAEQVRPTLATR